MRSYQPGVTRLQMMLALEESPVPLTGAELREATGLSEPSMRRRLNELLACGLAKKVSREVYTPQPGQHGTLYAHRDWFPKDDRRAQGDLQFGVVVVTPSGARAQVLDISGRGVVRLRYLDPARRGEELEIRAQLVRRCQPGRMDPRPLRVSA